MSGMGISAETTENTQIQVRCSQCGTTTNHRVVKAVDLAGYDEEAAIHFDSSYQIVQCLGCNSHSFRAIASNSDDIDFETGNAVVREDQYPNPQRGRVPLSGLMFSFPMHLERIYAETVKALNEKQLVLCGVGVRAVIECIVKDQGATGKDLLAQIDSLVKGGKLTTSGGDILHQIRTLGNLAAHQVAAHSREELWLALDVIDNLLQAVYILPQEAAHTFKKFSLTEKPSTP